MSTQFALDLRLARRKAGYTQDDVAHLLGIGQSGVSDLEHGVREPLLEQIIDLSLIYGRSFDSFFEALMLARCETLKAQLATMPEPAELRAETYNRPRSLTQLKQRLDNPPTYGA